MFDRPFSLKLGSRSHCGPAPTVHRVRDARVRLRLRGRTPHSPTLPHTAHVVGEREAVQDAKTGAARQSGNVK
eukprot:1020669-Prymnesium_polylepis.1